MLQCINMCYCILFRVEFIIQANIKNYIKIKVKNKQKK